MHLRIGAANREIRIGTCLLCLIAIEASLLGSGRLLQFGPLTLKMWLFIAAQLYVVARLFIRPQLKLSTLILLLSLVVLLCMGVMIGMVRDSTFVFIGSDVSPLLYCLILLFFDMVLTTQKQVRRVVQIIESASIIMSAGYIVIVGLLLFGIIKFLTLYSFLATSQQALIAQNDFVFRGREGFFFYKGALYIAIGMIFFAFEKSKWKRLAIAVTALGLLATGTRGFFISLAGIVLVHVCTSPISGRRKFTYVTIAFTSVVLLLGLLLPQQLGNKGRGDAVRIETIQQVEDRITPWSLLVGNGLGVGVPVRQYHMEFVYLEIFHKQGLLGLLWWFSVLAFILVRYIKARRVNYRYAQPLFLSAIYVVFESFTNSEINNPLGIFVWMFALVGLGVATEIPSEDKLSAQAPD